MKLKKTATRLLAVAMAVSMTAGCGAGGSVKTSDTVGGESVMNAGGLPIVNSDYSFSLFVDGSADKDELIMMPEFEKQTGISVDLQMYPYEIALEKLSLALSSGDYADCIGGWVLGDKDILTYGLDMKVFVPLEDYFEQYCPKIMEVLEIKGVRETMTAPDGHIYAIPYVVEAPEVDFNPYVNTKWLQNLGLSVPTTTEELREVLRAFKEQDANGNGDPNDEIPFSIDPNNRKIGLMCGWFGMSVDKYGFTMVGDQPTFGANTEQFKNGIKFFNSLYEEGLIDQEVFTQDLSQWKAKGGQDKYGACFMYGSGDIMPYDDGVVPDWQAIPVLSSPECADPVWLRNSYGVSTLRSQAVITDNAKNPEIICRWFDNVFAFENSLQLKYGPLGIQVFKEGDEYSKIDVTTMSEEDQKKYNWVNRWPQSLPSYMPAMYRPNEANPAYEEKPIVDKLYQPYLTERVPDYWVDPESAGRFSDIQTSLESYMTQKIAEWVSGQADIDAEWDSYLKQLDKLNLQEYIDMRMKALNHKTEGEN